MRRARGGASPTPTAADLWGPRAHLLDYQEAELPGGSRFDRTGEGCASAAGPAANLALRLLFGLRVRDVNFAFKLVRRSLLDRIALARAASSTPS
jgi:hypothetical protein